MFAAGLKKSKILRKLFGALNKFEGHDIKKLRDPEAPKREVAPPSADEAQGKLRNLLLFVIRFCQATSQLGLSKSDAFFLFAVRFRPPLRGGVVSPHCWLSLVSWQAIRNLKMGHSLTMAVGTSLLLVTIGLWTVIRK